MLRTNDAMGYGNVRKIGFLKFVNWDLRIEDSVVNSVYCLAHCTADHKDDMLVLSRCPWGSAPRGAKSKANGATLAPRHHDQGDACLCCDVTIIRELYVHAQLTFANVWTYNSA